MHTYWGLSIGKIDAKDEMKFDKNLIKEIKALKINKGKFKIIAQESFSSSQFINENSLQNFNQDCKDCLFVQKQMTLSS